MIFKQQSNDDCNDDNYQHCPAVTRIATTLKYYQSLDIHDKSHQNQFTNFVNTMHQMLFDDYIHVIKHHGHQIEDINHYFLHNQGFPHCDMNTCAFTSRHHKVENEQKKQIMENEADDIFNFYAETMDSLHFYIFHCFHAGLRAPAQDDNHTNIKISNDEYFDAPFYRLKRMISETVESTKSFQRFGVDNNSKFNISTKYDPQEHIVDDDMQETTYLDTVYGHLRRIGINDDVINGLKVFLQSEQYDTDALSNDICGSGKYGNISQAVDNEECIQAIINFITSSLSMSIIHISFKNEACIKIL